MKFDTSDRDGGGDDSDEEGTINLQDWPTVKGMYLPDSVNTFKAKADGRRCECTTTCLKYLCAAGVSRCSTWWSLFVVLALPWLSRVLGRPLPGVGFVGSG